MVHLGNDWDQVLAGEFEKDYYLKLRQFLKEEYSTQTIFPHMDNIFNALKYTAYEDVKAVILGQDPYHGVGQANVLCFSVNDGVQFPPSLQNIFKEIQSDLGTPIPASGNLDRWAEQGVLLLNSVLTVRAHQAASHAGKGWEQFTDAVVRVIGEQNQGIVYMLWGSYAQKKGQMADPSQNLILKSVHPSPLSVYRGFFGCKHFSMANEFLQKNGVSPIDWQIEEL